MDLASRIRHARALAGFSQAQLADRLGLQRSAVGHWESARGKHPTTANLIAVAILTGVRLEWLATGSGLARAGAAPAQEDIPAVFGMLIDDELEMRLVEAFRSMGGQARTALVALVEATRAGRRERPSPNRSAPRR